MLGACQAWEKLVTQCCDLYEARLIKAPLSQKEFERRLMPLAIRTRRAIDFAMLFAEAPSTMIDALPKIRKKVMRKKPRAELDAVTYYGLMNNTWSPPTALNG
jgi:hypothetical protein